MSNRRRAGVGAAVMVCLSAATGAWLQARQGPPAAAPAQPPRAGVDIVRVDATVVGQDGTPPADLGTADFAVTIDGRARRVASVHYVDLSAQRTQTARETRSPREATFSTNDSGSAAAALGSTTVLAVDHGSFLPGRGRQTLEAAKRFLARLDPSEKVALAAYPDPGFLLLPTTDRAALLAAVDRIAGTAAGITPPGVNRTVGISEAVELAAGNQLTLDRVLARECSGFIDTTARQACVMEAQESALGTVRVLRNQAIRSLAGLAGIVSGLQAVDGRKNLVVVSAGLFQSDLPSDRTFRDEMRRTTEVAARANASINVIHVEDALVDAIGSGRGRMTETAAHDATLMRQGLDTLADLNSGAVFLVTGGADTTFERLARELSGYYQLAVEAERAERDGRPHAIRIRVAKRGIAVRQRSQLTITDANAASSTPDARLAEALRSGRFVRDLPLRVSTQTFRDPVTDGLRVLVRADIGTDAVVPADFRVALAVYDPRGQLAGSTTGLKHLIPTRGAGATFPYLEALNLPAGRYTLRLAVMDMAGRIGSVAHQFAAGLTRGESAGLSDILIVDAERASQSQLLHSADGHIVGRTLAAIVEVYPLSGQAPTDVSFAIAAAPEAPPLLTVEGAMTPLAKAPAVTALVEFDLRLLPPGDYVVTATARNGEVVMGRVSRPFALASVAPAASDSPAASRTTAVPGAGGDPPIPGDASAFGRSFESTDVLAPGTVAFFIQRLRGADPRASSPPASVAIDAALRGQFEAILPALEKADDNQLSVAFLRGLARFAGREFEAAATQFRVSLRLASNFLPSAFYLGACYAAGGHDAEAIGAWRTSMISESEARILHDVLADALLRTKAGVEAVAVITEARRRWPEDESWLPRLAAAQRLAGQPGASLDTIEAYLARHPGDADALVLGVRVLYDAHAAGRRVRSHEDDLALATRFAAAYRATGGPHAALLDGWVDAIRKSEAGGTRQTGKTPSVT